MVDKLIADEELANIHGSIFAVTRCLACGGSDSLTFFARRNLMVYDCTECDAAFGVGWDFVKQQPFVEDVL